MCAGNLPDMQVPELQPAALMSKQVTPAFIDSHATWCDNESVKTYQVQIARLCSSTLQAAQDVVIPLLPPKLERHIHAQPDAGVDSKLLLKLLHSADDKRALSGYGAASILRPCHPNCMLQCAAHELAHNLMRMSYLACQAFEFGPRI
jgi:hypothetical protein